MRFARHADAVESPGIASLSPGYELTRATNSPGLRTHPGYERAAVQRDAADAPADLRLA